jgi:hypothetical protein
MTAGAKRAAVSRGEPIIPHAMRFAFLGVSILIGAACTTAGSPPDLVVVNGRVFTGVPAQPWSEAVAVRGDRIVSLGVSSDIRAQAAATTRVIERWAPSS